MTRDQAVAKAKELLDKLTFGQKAGLFLLSSAALTGLFLLIVWSGKPQYRLLVGDLDSERAGEIVKELNARGVAFTLENNGTSIYVPYDQADKLRIELAAAGALPSGQPKGYELFDEFKIGVPESIQLVNRKRALEGELSRTIGRIKAVKSATVHLTPTSERAYRKHQKPAKASVMIELSGSLKLTADQVAGIAHLVSGSVENLAPEDVTVLDSRGNVLSQMAVEAGMSLVSKQLQIQQDVESYRTQKAQTMLDNVLGPGKATVRVSAQLDFQKTESTVETYDPDGQVIRMESVNKSESRAPAPGGPTGAAARLGGLAAAASNNTNDSNERKTEYENSKTVQRTVNDGVRIERLAVSLILDETLSDKQQNLESIVKNAVGFEDVRGDTFNAMLAPFPPPEQPPPPPGFLDRLDLMESIRYGTAVVSFLFAFLLIRFLVGKGKKGLQVEAATPSAAVVRVEAPEEMDSERAAIRDEVIRAIEQDPVEASRLFKSWMEEED